MMATLACQELEIVTLEESVRKDPLRCRIDYHIRFDVIPQITAYLHGIGYGRFTLSNFSMYFQNCCRPFPVPDIGQANGRGPVDGRLVSSDDTYLKVSADHAEHGKNPLTLDVEGNRDQTGEPGCSLHRAGW